MTTAVLGVKSTNVIVPVTPGSNMPAGIIISYSGAITGFTTTAVADSTNLIHKDGWAVCNGASIPFATYSQLYARLSTTWNATTDPLTGRNQSAPADTGVNFRIPNLQGVFLRSVADYAESDAYSTDNDVALAAFKVDQGQGHYHGPYPGENGFWFFGSGGNDIAAGSGSGGITSTGSPITDGTNGTPRTGKETSPKQVGVYYLVKLYDNLAPVDVYIPDASASVPGIVTTGVQTFAGAKTFSSHSKVHANHGGNLTKSFTAATDYELGNGTQAWTEVTDTNSEFNPTTGRFLPTTAGWYHILYQISVDGPGDGGYLNLKILKGGSDSNRLGNVMFNPGGTQAPGTQVSAIVYLNGSEYVSAWITTSYNGNRTIYGIETLFSAYRIP